MTVVAAMASAVATMANVIVRAGGRVLAVVGEGGRHGESHECTKGERQKDKEEGKQEDKEEDEEEGEEEGRETGRREGGKVGR